MIQTRTLTQVVAQINSYNPNVSVSIHLNATPRDPTTNQCPSPYNRGTGPEGWAGQYSSQLTQSQSLASYLVDGVAARVPRPKRNPPVKTGNLYVQNINAPAAIIEAAFDDRPEDLQYIRYNKTDYARGIADGIVNYLQSMEAPSRPEVIVDDRSGGFQRFGPSQWWYEASVGYASHMYWTWNNQSVVDNYARWVPSLVAGNYEVYAFIPCNYATGLARYTIRYSNGSTQKAIDQNLYCSAWISLGTYAFASGTQGNVELVDANGQTGLTRQIGFDAVKFTPR